LVDAKLSYLIPGMMMKISPYGQRGL
jgi:hypothetical protein